LLFEIVKRVPPLEGVRGEWTRQEHALYPSYSRNICFPLDIEQKFYIIEHKFVINEVEKI
jgi:hypothetical protein